jgi:hypothetical protein
VSAPHPPGRSALQPEKDRAIASGKTSGKRHGANRRGILTRLHRDGAGPQTPGVRCTDHPSGEINVWLPVSGRVDGADSLWCDASPWPWPTADGTGQTRGRRPFTLQYGEAMLFYGNACAHETIANTTIGTRCSIDFRFIPDSLFEPRYFKRAFCVDAGYYVFMDLQTGHVISSQEVMTKRFL